MKQIQLRKNISISLNDNSLKLIFITVFTIIRALENFVIKLKIFLFSLLIYFRTCGGYLCFRSLLNSRTN